MMRRGSDWVKWFAIAVAVWFLMNDAPPASGAVSKITVTVPSVVGVDQPFAVKVSGLTKGDVVTGLINRQVVFGPKRSTGSALSFDARAGEVGTLSVVARVVRKGKASSVSATSMAVSAGSDLTTQPSTPIAVAGKQAPAASLPPVTTLPAGTEPGPPFPLNTWIGIPPLSINNKKAYDYLTPDGNRIVACGYFGEIQIHDFRFIPRINLVDSLPPPANSVTFDCPLFSSRGNIVGLSTPNWPGYSRPVGVVMNLDSGSATVVSAPIQKLSGDGSTVLSVTGADWSWERAPEGPRPAITGASPLFAQGSGNVLDLSDSGDSLLFTFVGRGEGRAGAYVRNMKTNNLVRVGEQLTDFSPRVLASDGSTVLFARSDAIAFVDAQTGLVGSTVSGFDRVVRVRVGPSGTKAIVQDRTGLYFVRPTGARQQIIDKDFWPGEFHISADFATLSVPSVARGGPAGWTSVYRFGPNDDVARS
jgi:hypothetical protein